MSRYVDVRSGRYVDSVRLMQVSRAVAAADGVSSALIAMATELNLDVLAGMGFDVPQAGPNDLLVAIDADADALDAARAVADAELAGTARAAGTATGGTAVPPRTTASALRGSAASLVLISVPGPSATAEAMDGLAAGRHVMLFSDNVPVEQEVALKTEAQRRGLLLMGPDCGTAVVQGVALGFANVVRSGPVGVVAASGTGAQQVSCLLDAAGVGISHLIGVGGRDLSEAVGARATVQALRLLAVDPATERIVVVSKPAAEAAGRRVEEVAADLGLPVHLALLGAGHPDLTAATEAVLAAAGVPRPSWPERLPAEPSGARSGGHRLVGLFAGGTLAAEAALLAAPLGRVRSNVGADADLGAAEILTGFPAGHLVVDFGADELTGGRAHPMIDPELRLASLARWAADPATAVVLLDVVLGYAADPDPAASLAPAIRAARDSAGGALPVVVSLCGTPDDPQGWQRQAEALAAAGAEVYLSNAAATRRAVALTSSSPPTTESPIPDAVTPDVAPAVVAASDGEADAGARAGAAELLSEPLAVLAVGAELFADSLVAQACPVERVDWRPPALGRPEDIARVAVDPRRDEANRSALSRLLAAGAELVDVVPAATALSLPERTFLHAGPPLTWDRASGPMRGALIGAVLLEGLADSPEDAQRLLERGGVALEPCHHHRTVGPMAGVVTPSMWMFELRDPEHGGTAYCSLNEGLGKVLRYGAYSPDVLDRLRWMSAVLGPALRAAVRGHGPVDVRAIVAQMLQMGDEGHNRNRAGTLMLLRELLGELVGAGGPQVAEVVRFVAGNDHFFLNLVMPAAKLALDAARDIPGSSMVVAMSRNGTDFGIQVSGTGDDWFTAPAEVPDGLFLGAFGPADANPDIGDSAITETVGLGGFCMAAAPAIVRFVGGDVTLALSTTRSMYEITLGENPAYAIPILDFRGAPTGIDVLAVARTGLLPQINTGMAGKVAGTGQVGAGLVKPPAECFAAALRALAERTPGSPGASAGPGTPVTRTTLGGS